MEGRKEVGREGGKEGKGGGKGGREGGKGMVNTKVLFFVLL